MVLHGDYCWNDLNLRWLIGVAMVDLYLALQVWKATELLTMNSVPILSNPRKFLEIFRKFDPIALSRRKNKGPPDPTYTSSSSHPTCIRLTNYK